MVPRRRRLGDKAIRQGYGRHDRIWPDEASRGQKGVSGRHAVDGIRRVKAKGVWCREGLRRRRRKSDGEQAREEAGRANGPPTAACPRIRCRSSIIFSDSPVPPSSHPPARVTGHSMPPRPSPCRAICGGSRHQEGYGATHGGLFDSFARNCRMLRCVCLQQRLGRTERCYVWPPRRIAPSWF